MAYSMSHFGLTDEHPTEHPKEHPPENLQDANSTQHKDEGDKSEGSKADESKADSKKEMPTKKHKRKNKTKKQDTSWNKQKVENDLLSFVEKGKAQEGKVQEGTFLVKDEVLKTTRNLTLDKIHSDKIVQLSDGTSFVCADFKDSNGEKVDVDFFMTPTQDGSVQSVSRVQVHKVNGKARYNYVKKQGQWVQVSMN